MTQETAASNLLPLYLEKVRHPDGRFHVNAYRDAAREKKQPEWVI